MKTKFLILVMTLFHIICHSQQDAQFTQYMYNTVNVNPAYAGSRGAISIFGLHRTQWVGLDGAPVSSTFSLNAPLGENMGGGISFINDRIGPTNENKISADMSYTINTSEIYKLSFGIKVSANLFSLDISKLNPVNSGDPDFQDLHNSFVPNLGAGIYFHSDKSYVGLSVPNFFETNRYDDNSVAINKERLNFYLIGGYIFNLTPSLKFKPAFLAKVVQAAPFQLDLSGNFLINEKFVLGAAWRWSAAASLMAGFQVNRGVYIGYGYDLETTKLANYNSGSHEIFMRFEIFKSMNRIVSPRFF
ncbi:type IX secretion system membrane protein PorP/SprF [Flavobacterium sp. 245]|uniref:PorP/SprF family type IX secretion system membrane protein n=1 Tax=Flavobacterium sp. 245 TaxID=2512115 RepID=UPI00105F766B|nr:type IX secretion system membrane protein PorP/SprF [Flavobacterium sp. 245]TDO96167.1 type IX secretion system PorP/SprF family membrane protein [Flavobacterium sp. 245]